MAEEKIGMDYVIKVAFFQAYLHLEFLHLLMFLLLLDEHLPLALPS